MRGKRRQPPAPKRPTPAPNDGTPLGHLTEEQLLEELVRRRMARTGTDLTTLEEAAEAAGRQLGTDTLVATLAALPPEGDAPKPCPTCGRLVPIRSRHRERTILTLCGEVKFSRNYHHCDHCGAGFSPRDAELGLPPDGDLSEAMERRIADFGVNDSFAAAAERWSVHYPWPISENLVRKVIDRLGAHSDATAPTAAQLSALPAPDEPAGMLVVAADGSMLCTRESAWKEAKVGVVARADPLTGRASDEVRYVAAAGELGRFEPRLAAALRAELAEEVVRVAWVGDGAPWIWGLAERLCPLAVQILDWTHALQHAIACGKVLLGEQSPAATSWAARCEALLAASDVNAFVGELLDCLPFAENEDGLSALDDLVRYFRTNERRMDYATFRENHLPIGSGLVESAHRHVLQVRMKRAGQRWGLERADRMARLRAIYRTAGPRRFHWAVRHAPAGPESQFISI